MSDDEFHAQHRVSSILVAPPSPHRPLSHSSDGNRHDGNVYNNAALTDASYRVLSEMRRDGVLCDVTLLAGTTPDDQPESDAHEDLPEESQPPERSMSINAHRAVLASASPYFYAMFTGDMCEAKLSHVNIHGITFDALSMLIDYIYTQELAISDENVQVLLPAASILQLNDVRNACCAYLQTQLHVSNCLGIRDFADLHACIELKRRADEFVHANFENLMNCEEFLRLTHNQVGDLVANDQLTSCEERVFEAVMAWVRSNPDDRQQHLAYLMEHVRLPLLPKNYLVKIDSEPLIRDSPQCKDFLIEAFKFHLMKGDAQHGLQFQSPRVKPRQPMGKHKLLIVIGGQAPKAIRNVDVYDFESEKWSVLTEMPQRRCRCGIACMTSPAAAFASRAPTSIGGESSSVGNNGAPSSSSSLLQLSISSIAAAGGSQIFAVGGFNGSMRLRTVDVYDVGSDKWIAGHPMDARRSTLGVATLGQQIFAIGGFDGSVGLYTCESYDPRVGGWETIASMSTRRSSVGVAVLRNTIYAVGGYDGQSRHCLQTVERYEQRMNEWVMAPEMTTRRSGAGVAVIDGLLYAVGGHDGPMVKRSVEVFNVAEETWTPLADMQTMRRNAGVIAINGHIYAVGGDDGNSNLTTVEVYNPVIDQWSSLARDMPIGRSYAGISVIGKADCAPPSTTS